MPPPPPAVLHHHRRTPLLPPLLAAAIALAFFSLSVVLYRKIKRRRTAPADLKPPFPPQRFSLSLLRRATDSFAAETRIGQGGFGSVHRGTLPSGQEIAVKLTSEASIQGEREFHNELSLATRMDTACCPHVVCVLGFSTSENRGGDYSRFRCYGRRKRRRGRKLALVYEYMPNGSLQDALLDRKCPELMHWDKSREDELSTTGAEEDEKVGKKGEDYGSIIEENESLVTEDTVVLNVDQSPDDAYCLRILDDDDEEVANASEKSPSDEVPDRSSVDSANVQKEIKTGKEKGEDWWWKQENTTGLSDSGRVKDYVMEWIGNEINKERPKKEWVKSTSSIDGDAVTKSEQKKQRKKKLEWWASLDREATKRNNNRKPREWWKEEFCDELAKKKKKRGPKPETHEGEDQLWWQKDDHDCTQERKRRSKGSRTSLDRWFESFSGEFRIGRRSSRDLGSNNNNNDVPKSGNISSTPSMRGTVCYIAPEYSAGAPLSEKCDVYSFGVLLLVVVSGRRPLQVTASPVPEFERANLISWARQLALGGRLLELVDPGIESLDSTQAVLCLTVGLLCLQRSPEKRPTVREIVGMLSGESEPPVLPFEFSPSPPTSFPFKSRKK
ncbi:kinase family protein, partial [Striga asiatica]